MTSISQRLGKLEERFADRHAVGRVFRCIVRHGRQTQDMAEAFARLGESPTGRDLTICRIITTADPGDRMLDIHPTASVVGR